MERYSDEAIRILDDLHTERLDYHSEYLPLIDAAQKLDAYESTGMEPEDILNATDMAKVACALRELNQYKELGDLDRLRELVEADREGRCVMLSTPMRPMICKPNDTDVYCPRCGETLSGGWPESDYYDYRKMVQCPNCGESIDDNKCETVERRAT